MDTRDDCPETVTQLSRDCKDIYTHVIETVGNFIPFHE